MTSPYLGSIMLFAGNFAPRGYYACNGQLLSIAQNSALFSLLGTTYGGDGQNTFAVPDLRGRVMLSFGQGPGLTFRPQGQIGGAESVTISTANLPAHTHAVTATTAVATTTSPANALPATPDLPSAFLYLDPAATGTSTVAPDPSAISAVGGGQPHTNIMPTLALTYVIAAEGIFPSRN